jgi:hypothetical protein
MAFRIFDAEGRVTVDDDTSRGLSRVANKVRETVARVDAMEGTAQLKADATDIDRKIQKVRGDLRSLDRQRATATADMDTSAFDVKEAKLQQKLRALQSERVEIDVRMGKDLKIADRALVGLITRLRGVGRVTPWQDVQRLGDALHNARITMGPLSLSLRGLIVALLTLAPLVSGVAGALGGLVAVAGQGLVGALGLGAAALMGFGGLLAGVVGAIIAHRKQFKQFGDDVKELGAEFKRQTRIPTSFFDAIREGIATARADMPIFTSATNTALDTVGRSFTDLFRSLRSGSMQDTLRQLFGNANEALGPLLRGINSLIRSATNIGASFSRHLEPATRGFMDWARGVERATRNSEGLDRTVDELMKSAEALGDFFVEAGELVVNFFMAGGPAGRRMLREITDLVDKWGDFLASEEGQRAVTKFLDDSWDTVKKLAGFLEQVVRLIDNLATAGKPVVDWLLEAADNALELLNNLEDATGAGDELVTGLAGLIILRRAVGWASALVGILGGGAIAKGLGGLGKGLLQKIIFPAGAGAAGAGLAGAFRTALGMAIKGVGLGTAGVLLGELANGVKGQIDSVFQQVGIPGAVRSAFSKIFEMLPAGQLGQIIDQIKNPLDTIKRAWENLGRLPGVRLVATFVDRVRGPAIAAFNTARNAFRRGIDLIGRFVSNIPGAARTAFSFVRNLYGRGIDLVGSFVDSVSSAARSVFGRARGLFNRGIDLVGSFVDSVSSAARSTFNRAKSIFAPGVDLVASLIDNATSAARSIMSTIEGIFHDITVSISIPTPKWPTVPSFLKAKGGLMPVTGYARGTQGGGFGDPVTPRIVEQAMAKNNKRRDGGKVFSPQFINSFNIVGEELGNSEFVIPTNPAYRRRARALLAQAVATIGVGFARGANAAGRRRRRPKKVYSGSHYLFPVRQLENEIDMKDNALQTFDRRYNIDSRFKPLVDDNGQRIEANINWHLTTLKDLENRAGELSRLETRLSKAIERAHNQLRNAINRWRDQRPPATKVVGKGKNRRRVTNPKFTAWENKMQGLQSAFGEVPFTDAREALQRSDGYESDKLSYAADQREVRETKSTPLPKPGMEEWLAGAGLLGSLQDLNLGVAQAAATIGDAADDRAAAGNLANFWQGVIDRIGPGGDRELLTEAYSNLASARGMASDTGGGSSTPDMGTQIQTFNAARDALFQAFAPNFASSSTSGGILGAISSGVSSGVVSGLAGARSGVISQPSAGAPAPQKVVNYEQTNNYAAPPPDPHTFTQSMAWEAQAL